MKTNPPHPVSTTRQASLFTLLGLAWLLIMSVLTPAHGANTFANTGPLVTGRYLHSATLLHNGKVLVLGGGNTNYLASAELYDPATGVWTATGGLVTARLEHTATLLPNGKVLVAGGSDAAGFFASAEIYDPATGLWIATGDLVFARSSHTATLLPNGKVLVAGGYGDSGVLSSAELYDPATGVWSVTGSLASKRFLHTATLLPSGKVLVAGGATGTANLASAQLYDPATGLWTATGSFTTARTSHTATLLPNGKVLLAGGSGSSGVLTNSALYDPAAGTWSATGALGTARLDHTATLLPNGKVLVSGGSGTSAELYDSTAGTWSPTGALAAARADHTATLLPNGKVLIAGGRQGSAYPASAELYDSSVGAWSNTGPLATARRNHTATLLANGKVLVAGGQGTGGAALASAELYDPATGLWGATGTLATARYNHTATLLPSGKVLIAGGTYGTSFASAELYDPATGVWTATGALATARHFHTATLLPNNGKVLVVSGFRRGVDNSFSFLSTAELYDPLAGTWSATAGLVTGRGLHTATLLPNGKVLIAGGEGASEYGSVLLALSAFYDPVFRNWQDTSYLLTARSAHTATLLPNGKVLVAAGYGSGSPASAEIYSDPAAGTWSATGSLPTAGVSHTATLLPNGTVLVAGLGPIESLYDPATGTWSATVALATARYTHTATLLPDGKVLVAGGYAGGAALASAELYDVGLGFSGAWQPQISAASFDAVGRLVLIGTGFLGITAWDSPMNYPFVQLRRLDNEQSAFLLPDPATPFSSTGFTSVPVAPFSGYAQVTVFANGIPSAALIVVFPDVAVEQPVGTAITDGGTQSFGSMFVGSPMSLIFTIKNPNPFNLTGLTITKDGTNAADFTVTASPTAPVLPGGSTTFTIQFAPATSGAKTAALHIANNVLGKNPYDINLTGQAYSFTQDTDGDGLNDASEFQLAALGFNWQVSQTNLVNTLSSNLNGTGLVQALNVGTPLLTKNAGGQFTLTIGVEKSTDLSTFNPFPMTAPQTLINGQGKLEFQFTVPDNAAFFRLEAH